jgi:uncharacterized protein (DUF1499 family)
MISLKIILIGIPVFIILALAALSFNTRQSPIKAQAKDILTDCPDSKNCVFSQASRTHQKVEPLKISDENAQTGWNRLIAIIKQQGGEIKFNDGKYCHAVFTSTLFRFKDDLELLLDQSQIHIRSASRAGKSDLGVNRKRVEEIRGLFDRINFN